MRRLLALLMLAQPAAAADLWCMPDRICRPDGTCRANADEESSLRIRGHDGAAPVLRAHAEDIALRVTRRGDVVEWRGTGEGGSTEILAWRPADRAFTHLRRTGDGRQWTATGICEVQ